MTHGDRRAGTASVARDGELAIGRESREALHDLFIEQLNQLRGRERIFRQRDALWLVVDDHLECEVRRDVDRIGERVRCHGFGRPPMYREVDVLIPNREEKSRAFRQRHGPRGPTDESSLLFRCGPTGSDHCTGTRAIEGRPRRRC